jgi:spore coat protein A, manganese oxidase
MKRRDFVKAMGIASAAVALPFKLGRGALKEAKAVAAGKKSKYIPPFSMPPWPSAPYPSTSSAVMSMISPGINGYLQPLLSHVPVFTPIGTYKNTGKPLYNVQFKDKMQQLHPNLPPTPVFCYGQDDATLNYPGFSFDLPRDQEIYVKYTNNLPTKHILPVDPTIPGAQGMKGMMMADGGPASKIPMSTILPETRAVVHVHGAFVMHASDGWPDFWLDPKGKVAPKYTYYNYKNHQDGCCLWYHDHGMATTRLNVHAGLAGFYLLRDAAEAALNIPQGNSNPYEIPIVFQDRMFNPDGSFLYPNIGSGGLPVGKYPAYDFPSGHPIWVPEFFGDVAVVNGGIWPTLTVKRGIYRFRMLNGCDARFLNLYLQIGTDFVPVTSPGMSNYGLASSPDGPFLPMYLIGTDGGLLPQTQTIMPTDTDPWTGNNISLTMAPAFRCDVLIDFSTGLDGSPIPDGTTIYLVNDGPGPWPGGGSNVLTQIMQFVVQGDAGTSYTIPEVPNPNYVPLNPANSTAQRFITLNEWLDPVTGTSQGMLLGEGLTLGPNVANPPDMGRNGIDWNGPVTIKPVLGAQEEWWFINRTGDGHPMHLHLVQFQFLDRFNIVSTDFDNSGTITIIPGSTTGPLSYDLGNKDTIIAPPGDGATYYTVTRIMAQFPSDPVFAGEKYPYHCHIIEHEDSDMMRWFQVVAPGGVNKKNKKMHK